MNIDINKDFLIGALLAIIIGYVLFKPAIVYCYNYIINKINNRNSKNKKKLDLNITKESNVHPYYDYEVKKSINKNRTIKLNEQQVKDINNIYFKELNKKPKEDNGFDNYTYDEDDVDTLELDFDTVDLQIDEFDPTKTIRTALPVTKGIY